MDAALSMDALASIDIDNWLRRVPQVVPFLEMEYGPEQAMASLKKQVGTWLRPPNCWVASTAHAARQCGSVRVPNAACMQRVEPG
jgi:hypothetical protein